MEKFGKRVHIPVSVPDGDKNPSSTRTNYPSRCCKLATTVTTMSAMTTVTSPIATSVTNGEDRRHTDIVVATTHRGGVVHRSRSIHHRSGGIYDRSRSNDRGRNNNRSSNHHRRSVHDRRGNTHVDRNSPTSEGVRRAERDETADTKDLLHFFLTSFLYRWRCKKHARGEFLSLSDAQNGASRATFRHR